MATKQPKQATLTLIVGAALIGKEIDGIKNAAAKLDTRIHVAALSVASHAHEHGDVTLAQKLVEALGKGMRRNALLAWLVKFGPFAPSEDGKSVVHAKGTEFDLESAKAQPWYDFKQEPAFRPFDLDAMLEKLVENATKALNDKEHPDAHNVNAAKLERIKALMAGDL